MNRDPERFLERLTPRGASAALRKQVLEEVARELAAPPRTHGLRWTGAALAASLLLGIALNIGLVRVQDSRLAAIYGPPPVPRRLVEMTQTVESVVGQETASWFEQEWLEAVRRRPVSGREGFWRDYYSQLLGEDWLHEKASQDPGVPRDRRRSAGGARPARQCRLDLDYRQSA